MKKLLLILVIFSSCSKDKDNPGNVSASGSISYKVNGNLVTMDNANILNGEGVAFAKQLKGSILTNTRYLLNAQKGINNILSFTIQTDTLQQQSYRIDSIAVFSSGVGNIGSVMFNGQMAGVFFDGDVFDSKITSYSNSKVSGTFSAKLTPIDGFKIDYGKKSTIIITEGKLNNIPVSY